MDLGAAGKESGNIGDTHAAANIARQINDAVALFIFSLE